MDHLPTNGKPPVPAAAQETPRVVRSSDLLRGSREVLIEHGGSVYRLRETRNGKLILGK